MTHPTREDAMALIESLFPSDGLGWDWALFDPDETIVTLLDTTLPEVEAVIDRWQQERGITEGVKAAPDAIDNIGEAMECVTVTIKTKEREQ